MHEDGTWWDQYLHLLQNPAHWIFEITVQVVIDLVILYFGYQILWKRVVLPKVRRDIHAEIDRDHDLIHDDDTYHSKDIALFRSNDKETTP